MRGVLRILLLLVLLFCLPARAAGDPDHPCPDEGYPGSTSNVCAADPYDSFCAEKNQAALTRAKTVRTRAEDGAQDLKKLKPEVLKSLKAAYQIYAEMIDSASAIPVRQKSTVKELLLKCSQDVGIGFGIAPNGGLDQSGQLSKHDKAGAYADVDELCDLWLTPARWIDCAEGKPICFETLFHELGHRLNSCHFVSRAGSAEDRGLDAHAKESCALASTMLAATDCLNVISSPKNGLVNACEKPPLDEESCLAGLRKKWPDAVSARCGDDYLAGYPPQWNEAEADFWGASAMARWLESGYKSIDARQRVVAGIVHDHCAEAAVWNDRKDDAPTACAASKSKGSPTLKEVFKKISEASRDCRNVAHTKGEFPVPWLDAHQPRSRRLDRNLLRNSDLRKALGCGGQGAVVCAPTEPFIL